ncbi:MULTISPECIES: YhgE/Pip domain-containing protein [unclassified Pseudoclavibacter]|uniref:YhgE/Pip domain-containing protein n=1 Tax=unclassified Pseudoclavibacter TaxID=2615177 RepID=UPI001BA9135E|nr:YhgE/Pip domain-containing protein [Pseudoclavibacter sp. Marseille-Q4354]MBS3180384.1 YhgE/Pip domain-containing protein [Pseudoclavibacter sp. Marseille-Q4354]
MRSFSLPAFVRSHRRTLIVIVGIALIPLIYAGSLIWSNEDPTHRLDHINAAIVNSDQAATPATTAEGEPAEPVDLGATLTEKLVDSTESNNFSWHEMSADEAQSELESGKVLAVLEIPAGFSAAAVSAGGDDPLDAAIARLSITTNDGANIIVGNIASTVGTTVADELATEVSDEYLRNVYVGFTDIHESVSEAADGATELNDGAEQARTGSGQLVVGLGQLREGGLTLADGSATLADGAAQVDAGVQQLNAGLVTANSGAQTLSSGAADANAGAQQLSAGAATANTGAQELSAKLTEASSGAQLLSAGLAELNSKTSDLPASVTTLTEGATTLDAGATALAGGLETALGASRGLDDGTTALAAGAGDLSGGIDSLLADYDSLSDAQRKELLTQLSTAGQSLGAKAGELSAGTSALVGDAAAGTGLSYLQAKSTELAAGATQLSDGVSPLSGKVDELVAAVSTVSTKSAELASGTQQLSTGASTLATGTQSLADGTSTLATGTKSLADGASSLATGTQTLADGASTLAQSTPKLASGASELSSGATTLADGTADAESGGAELNDGITQLADGSKTLADGLDDGVSDIPSYTDAQADHLAGVTSTPVEITKTRLNEVPAYGYGLAPYFMTLGLWVGALAFYLMFPPLRERLVLGRQPAIVVALRSFAPGAMLGAAQSLLMLTIVRFGLGLEPADMLGLIALALLTSVTFVAVNQAFNALLGPPGRFLALIMIVLQLSSAGGTYPVETAPAFFQLIHSWLPLNYAVTAFRSLVAGGSIGIGEAYGMLTVWLVAALALTTLSIVIKRRRERLKPAAAPAPARTPKALSGGPRRP